MAKPPSAPTDTNTQQILLIRDLWSFIENNGTTDEFFDLRERVRGINPHTPKID